MKYSMLESSFDALYQFMPAHAARMKNNRIADMCRRELDSPCQLASSPQKHIEPKSRSPTGLHARCTSAPLKRSSASAATLRKRAEAL